MTDDEGRRAIYDRGDVRGRLPRPAKAIAPLMVSMRAMTAHGSHINQPKDQPAATGQAVAMGF